MLVIAPIHWHKVEKENPITLPENEDTCLLYSYHDVLLDIKTVVYNGQTWIDQDNNSEIQPEDGQIWIYLPFPPVTMAQNPKRRKTKKKS